MTPRGAIGLRADADPLLRAELARMRADPAELGFFQWVTIAARQAIALNHLVPAEEDR